MKNKTIFKAACAFTAASMLVACSSTQVASNFGKRKYTGGYFANNTGKVQPVTTYATNYPTTATATPVAPATENTKTVAASEAPVVANNAVITTSAAAPKQVSSVRAIAKSAKKAMVAAETKTEPNYGEVTVAKENKLNASPDSIANSERRGGGACKNWIICLLLCFFLGGLGIHRFYMGYIWQGVVQLLTGGGCGVWVLIDFIRIIIKSLKPKGGDYC